MIDTPDRDDYDSVWKDVLERYLSDFMAFFFPAAHADIDWSQGYRWLDTELRQVVRDAELGRRHADKLVEVQRRDGEPTLVYIHIEVQSQYEAGFAERMFVYHYRLHDRFHQPIVSLAILGDDRPTWKPTEYSYGLWGCELDFRFPVVKLLDYAPERAQLEANANPFATVVLAHLAAQETRQSDELRAVAKFALTRRLYGLGYARQAILDLYAFIDWLLRLPGDLEDQVWQQIKQFEAEESMSYITTAERKGRAEGRAEGLVEGRAEGLVDGIALALELKFGADGVALVSEIRQLADLTTLEAVLQRLKTASSTDEVRAVYAPPSN